MKIEEKDLYPELARYVYLNSSQFWNEIEKKAIEHSYVASKNIFKRKRGIPEDKIDKAGISSDPEVLGILDGGFEQFMVRLAHRILSEHGDEIDLNTCPKCQKICRTPKAKQCQFCFHSWHD